ncbi:MAG: hypothetical protein AUH72_04725 [Acidobacteria bacterium 13_1_40CM_4_65_8]|nr:MAG: hypothetical protein AUH72_04725 [Acidobacteria bacterium 13_1_40CM_4_65_8]
MSWTGTTSPDAATSAIAALERGDVVFFPSLRFVVHPDEAVLFTLAIRVLERLKGDWPEVGGFTNSPISLS